MTDEWPSERAIRESERLLRDWGVDPATIREVHKEREERKREATRLELQNKPPEPDLRNWPTIQTPGMSHTFANPHAVETEAQRQTRLGREEGRGKEPELEKQPEANREKGIERAREIPEGRPSRELLPPWARDPRWVKRGPQAGSSCDRVRSTDDRRRSLQAYRPRLIEPETKPTGRFSKPVRAFPGRWRLRS